LRTGLSDRQNPDNEPAGKRSNQLTGSVLAAIPKESNGQAFAGFSLHNYFSD
jgi:hypothetical protein